MIFLSFFQCFLLETQPTSFSRWLATVLVVLQTLMAQVTEDILLSRIDQSGFRPKCVNMIDKPLLPIEVGEMSQAAVFNALMKF